MTNIDRELSVAVEKLADLVETDDWARLFTLQAAHWREVAKFKDLLKLNPDINRYLAWEKEGRLQVVILRDGGRIVGYSVYVIVNNHPHYRTVTVAEDDIHYLAPHLRGDTGAHQKMRVYALEQLQMRGVMFVTARTKVGHDHDKGLRAIGFEPFDLVYACDLSKWTPPGRGMTDGLPGIGCC